jgi:hypothetical protein
MSALGAFCNQLIAFFEDLSESYPEDKEISVAAQALKLVKQANPRLIHTFFMNVIYNEFAEHVMTENEDYIVRRAKEILSVKYEHISCALMIFDKHWHTMSETNKQHVWRYLKSLILLAKRVEPA